MRSTRLVTIAGAAAVMSVGVFVPAWGSEALVQQTGPQNPPLVAGSLAGRDLFHSFCAACHGRDGKGGGPAAEALQTAPPDLTRIATRNGGEFPKARVEALITGGRRVPAAHGSSEMPVWGPIFHGLDSNDRLNRVRIANIVEYLGSIQRK